MWMLFLSIMFTSLSLQAQNVTIRANNGSTIAAVKNGGATDTFFGLGGFATWQHEQLSMVLTVSDGTSLTPNGQLDNPANNLFANGNYMQIAKGKVNNANVCYATISLPSGYRFTGYAIKFTKPRNAQNSEFNTGNNGTQPSTFGETNSTFATYTTQATINIGGAAQTITRTEMGEGDMGNVLYFKLQNPSSSRALIQLESAEFFFTSEENYSPVTPAGTIASPVSAVDVPFSTSKVDFGNITRRTYNGSTRVSYSSANVTDLEANFVLYEAESIKDGSDIDGISGKVVDYKAGTISSSGGYFKLGKENAEQVYYIETPTYVTLSNGTKNPVGYRIVGAEFEYTTSASQSGDVFYITYTDNGTTYYLNTAGRFTTTPVVWEIDSDGYISSNGLYLYWDNGYAATQTTKPGSGERFTIANNGRIYQTEYTSYYIRCYIQNGTYYGLITNNNYGSYAIAQDVPATNVDGFVLKIYDKSGANPQSISVTGTGKTSITGLNNDAVKFGVQGMGLVRATLTLQALDPYLDQMQVVCQDQVQSAVRMTQSFTASDFSVSGGKFYFYLPADCEGHNVLISFEDLKSKYFDETYTGGSASHTSRLNFVKSNHYNAFGASNNNVYTNRSEASNAQLERLKVIIVGTKAFKFNNADEVGTSGGTLTEYPFSLEKYAASPNSGTFTNMQFTVSTEDQELTRYVFTTDETRYNIAPTTATQHRAYAFYEMEVHVQSGTYEPKVEFKKIYDETLYGTGQNDAFYGAVITATDGNGKPGYSSTQEIFKMIDRCINIDKVDDFGHTDIPNNHNKLLYLDFSQLAGVYEITTEEHQSMEDYAATNAKNCIIFIPKGQSAPNNNVAYKTESGGYMAANDIVLTDKEPFYTPYDIQVHSANKAVYKRLITKDGYGKVQNATLIMPFQLTVDNGKHTNVDGTSFTLHKMQATQAIALEGSKPYAYFPGELADVTVTEPHTPYLVQLTENSSEDGVSFVVSQNGTTIKATTGAKTQNGYKYFFDGETATGTIAAGGTFNDGEECTLTFHNQGTYAGQALPKAIGGNGVFYFARNRFVNSSELADDITTVKIAPFRTYYTISGAKAGAKMSAIDVVFGEGIGDEPDAVRNLRDVIDLGVKSGRGTITIAAKADNSVRIIGVNGISHFNLNMKAGEVKTVDVPAGLYIVNGVKILVK